MKLTILNVAYPLAPVGDDAVGGAEQVLAAIDAALVDGGHQSIVIASADSQVRGELIPIPLVDGSYHIDAMRSVHEYCRAAIRRALAERKVDLVHMHGVDFHAYLPQPGVPVLVTLHLPVSWYPSEVFHYTRPATFLHCVSEAQQRECPPCDYMLPPVRNGVGIPGLRRERNPQYALAIGRICPEKGFHLALDAATRAGIPLLLAGKVFPYELHEAYFRAEIEPRLRPPHVYAGPVGRSHKSALYAGARCMVVASTVPETTSLVALEALACGTPVIAFRMGALPDIVVDGQTGFLVDDVEHMAAAIDRAGEIDPEECIRVVRERFSLSGMLEQYMMLYQGCGELDGTMPCP